MPNEEEEEETVSTAGGKDTPHSRFGGDVRHRHFTSRSKEERPQPGLIYQQPPQSEARTDPY